MNTGIQWTGQLQGGETKQWVTYGWPASWHVVWYMMPTSPEVGAPQLDWDVAVERVDASDCTYWITVTNKTSNTLTFEGRYAVLS